MSPPLDAPLSDLPLVDNGRRHGLAFDRASVRMWDEDGRLHVAMTNLSKANVCPYFGREIPGGQHLAQDAIYMLLRDPGELARAAPTFNNIPLLSRHVSWSAMSYDPADIVGSTGTDAQFSDPYLQNSLVIWSPESQQAIVSGESRELSCAYRYKVDWTPGVYLGEKYDGVMRNLRGNHVAHVEAGRAGSDVLVADARLARDSMPTLTLRQRMAADTALNTRVLDILKPKLAQDATIDEVMELLDKAETEADKASASGGTGAADEKHEDKKDEDKLPFAKDAAKKAADEEKRGNEAENEPKAGKPAMDAAIVAGIRADVTREVGRALREQFQAAAVAREAVRPHVGEVALSMDSAESIYRYALDKAGVDVTGVHPSAYGAMVKMLPDPATPPARVVAMDAAASKGITDRWGKHAAPVSRRA